MPETFLMKLKDDSSEKDLQRVMAFLQRRKAKIVMAVSKSFIVLTDQQLAEVAKTIPAVERVGGVTVKRRKVKVLRRPAKGQ